MNKRNRKNQQYTLEKEKTAYVFKPLSMKLLFMGLPVLLLGLCDVGIRLYSSIRAGATGIMLLMAYDVECLVAGLAILVGGILLMDYLERSAGGPIK